MATKQTINYAQYMMKIIQGQMVEIMQADPEYYLKYNIILSNEQQYIKEREKNPRAIYIVVKFMSATTTHGQILLPVNFNALGEENAIEVCQRLLLEYAQTYTLYDEIKVSSNGSDNKYNISIPGTSNYLIKQVWQAPQVMSNFNSVYTGFRSLFYMSGTFLIGKDSLPITDIEYYYTALEGGVTVTKHEKLDFINATWDFTTQLDSQAFYGTDSITVSKSKVGTLGVSIALYMTSCELCKMVRAIAFRNKTKAPNGIKTTFELKLKFADGDVETCEFHLANVQTVQNLGEFPLTALSFTL